MTAIQMYESHPFYRGLVDEVRQSGSIPVDFIRMVQPAFEETDPATDTVSIAVDLRPQFTEFRADFGDGMQIFNETPEDVAYVNPSVTETRYEVFDEAEILIVAAPIGSIAEALRIDDQEVRNALEPLYYRMLKDPGIRVECLRMWRAASLDSPFSALSVDHGFLSLCASLLSQAQPNGIMEGLVSDSSGALSADCVRRVVEYMDANLSEQITLADLAEISGYSSFHFAREFKRATDATPHQFLVSRRLERVRDMLANTSLSITEIAFAVGFSSSQHLATAFRRETGVTPSTYRIDRRD